MPRRPPYWFLKKSGLYLGGSQGRLISEGDKEEALALIQEACKAGARKHLAAELLGLPLRTVQRWETHGIMISVKAPGCAR